MKPKSTLPKVPQALIEALERATRVVIVSHVKPDGDAFGSALGLAGFLSAAGRRSVVTGLQPVPESYAFLTGVDAIVEPTAYRMADGDLIAVCDCGAADRIPEALRPCLAKLPSVCIDHHKSNAGFAQVDYIDPAASSTAELVWRVSRRAGWPLDSATAEALWVGLVTDTGRFGYDNTSPATLRCAMDLQDRGGVRTGWINEQIYGSLSEAQLRLQARAINSLRRTPDGRVALVSLTQADYAACCATSLDSENFVDLPRSLRGTCLAAFVYAAHDDNSSRFSLRTTPPYDASEICRGLGGGGHARAAGATLPEPVPAASERVFTLLREIASGRAE